MMWTHGTSARNGHKFTIYKSMDTHNYTYTIRQQYTSADEIKVEVMLRDA